MDATKGFRTLHHPKMAALTPTQACRQIARHCLEQLSLIPDSSPLIGPLSDGMLRMPRNLPDKRKLTWVKFLNHTLPTNMACLYGSLRISPTRPTENCWFYPVNSADTNGYPSYKLSAQGSRNKYMIHRIMYSLFYPGKPILRDHVIAHRCRNGMRDGTHNYACVNPHHLVQVKQQVNISHNRCAHGAPELCPHNPACLWRSRDTGL